MICKFCKKNFTTVYSLAMHLETAKYCLLSQDNKNKLELISMLEAQVKELKDQLASIAKAAIYYQQ